jgi:hypothetical protein
LARLLLHSIRNDFLKLRQDFCCAPLVTIFEASTIFELRKSVKKIKTSFANVGAYSNEDNFIRGDPDAVIEWISGETKAFEEILGDRGDVCAFSGARGVSAILEKAGCNHVKTLA